MKLKFTAEDEEVQVRFEPTGQECEISASDHITVFTAPLDGYREDQATVTVEVGSSGIAIIQEKCLIYAQSSDGMDLGV